MRMGEVGCYDIMATDPLYQGGGPCDISESDLLAHVEVDVGVIGPD